MKASPNREQLLFLVTGGIILILILIVVIFNMVRSTGETMLENATAPEPKVKVGDRSTTPGKSSWLTQVAPAPIFNSDPAHTNPEPTNKIISQDLLSLDGQSPATKSTDTPTDKWSSPEASALESARLNAKPIPKETPVEAAPKKPISTKNPTQPQEPSPAPPQVNPEPKIPMPLPQMGQNFAALTKKNSEAAKTEPPEESDTNEPETKGTEPAPKQTTTTPPPPKRTAKETTEPEAASKTATKPDGFNVQLASYNDEEHTTTMIAKLSKLMFDGKRMPTFTTTQKSGTKITYRVHLGPFATENRAQRAANLANSKTGMKGLISGSAP